MRRKLLSDVGENGGRRQRPNFLHRMPSFRSKARFYHEVRQYLKAHGHNEG
jgi:hypothetical protein